MEKDWPLYLPCFSPGAAGERLASELEDGQIIIVTSGKLAYRKRQTKTGEQSRLEILVWAADRLPTLPGMETSDTSEPISASVDPALLTEVPSAAKPQKARKPRLPAYLRQPWEARQG